ncbi:MAG: hypothetical protein RJQ21_19380 [Rhodospirillales bacterium]
MRMEPTFGLIKSARLPQETQKASVTGNSLVPLREPGRDLVSTEPPRRDMPAAEPATEVRSRGGFVNVRKMSPRQMADLAIKLHGQGVLSYEEYSMLAYQPEMDPRYDDTIGALTGEEADPDRPRDFLKDWEDRLSFERRYGAGNSGEVRRTEKVLAVLHRFDRPLFLTT